jgi:short subunit dehydrogenase-like uncharacterized protein
VSVGSRPGVRRVRPLDLVLVGATGFVGRLTAAQLARSAPPDVRVALAGRSRSRLEQVRAALPPTAAHWPLVVADSADPVAMGDLARSTRVVVTTVGPYARHGLPLVQACAAAGTSYADVTGEVLFVRRSIDVAHAAAAASGARIVHACGFDSVPSDLGVLLAARQARADGTPELVDAVLLLVRARGGLSGGTVDSLRAQVDAARADPAARRVLADPYALSPDRAAEPDLGPQRDVFLARREPAEGMRWVASFPMAPVNTRIVRRSNALQGWAYGRRLRYREAMGMGRSPVAPLLAAGTGLAVAAVGAGMALPPTRAVLDRVLPSPGDGPGARARAAGHFWTRTTVTTRAGTRYRTTIRAPGDPGYAATSVMLAAAGLALLLDDLPAAAGVLTPATGIGAVLADRLRAEGFRIGVERLSGRAWSPDDGVDSPA